LEQPLQRELEQLVAQLVLAQLPELRQLEE
jgi:hypothetical protein